MDSQTGNMAEKDTPAQINPLPLQGAGPSAASPSAPVANPPVTKKGVTKKGVAKKGVTKKGVTKKGVAKKATKKRESSVTTKQQGEELRGFYATFPLRNKNLRKERREEIAMQVGVTPLVVSIKFGEFKRQDKRAALRAAEKAAAEEAAAEKAAAEKAAAEEAAAEEALADSSA